MVNYEGRVDRGTDGWRGALSDRRVLAAAAAGIVIGFLVGFVWQYPQAARHRSDHEATQVVLTFQQLESTLAAAAIEAHRGSYEIARQLASRFFSGLQQHLGHAPADARSVLQEILERRDAMITALSRADPQAAPLLTQLFFRYRTALGETAVPDGSTMPAPLPADSPED